MFYHVNADPAYWGFGLLSLPFDISLTEGFPVFQAVIDYSGAGYHAGMGWVQIVTVTGPGGRVRSSVDVAPIFRDIDYPFAEFGHLPTLFDAPGPNPPRSDETWVAESFLTVVPDVARSRRVRAVLGFRWGYDLKEMCAAPRPVELTSEADWQRCRAVLQDRYPNWEFDPGLHAE
ncbi:MAG: hypothetical protein ACRDJE_27935 [Dehalococcoidia bacterium]